jgi:hypothetical protein
MTARFEQRFLGIAASLWKAHCLRRLGYPRPQPVRAGCLTREENGVAQIFWTQAIVNLLLTFDGGTEHIPRALTVATKAAN